MAYRYISQRPFCLVAPGKRLNTEENGDIHLLNGRRSSTVDKRTKAAALISQHRLVLCVAGTVDYASSVLSASTRMTMSDGGESDMFRTKTAHLDLEPTGHKVANPEQWLALRVHGGARNWPKLPSCFNSSS